MKEATGEVSMTVIVIVLAALLIAVGSWLLGTNGPVRSAINKQAENLGNYNSNTR